MLLFSAETVVRIQRSVGCLGVRWVSQTRDTGGGAGLTSSFQNTQRRTNIDWKRNEAHLRNCRVNRGGPAAVVILNPKRSRPPRPSAQREEVLFDARVHDGFSLTCDRKRVSSLYLFHSPKRVKRAQESQRPHFPPKRTRSRMNLSLPLTSHECQELHYGLQLLLNK